MIRAWFFSFCIPRPSLVLSALSSLGHHVLPSIFRTNSLAPLCKPQVWDVLFSSFLPSTGGQGSEQRHFSLTLRQRGRILWGKSFCMIIITKAMKASQRNSSIMESELASMIYLLWGDREVDLLIVRTIKSIGQGKLANSFLLTASLLGLE